MHCESGAWTPSDIATVIIAIVAVLVSIASVVSTVAVHRAQGAVVRVDARWHAKGKAKVGYPTGAEVNATAAFRQAEKVYERFSPAEFYYTTFIRVVVTNKGRTDTSIDSISYVNSKKKGVATRQKDEPEYPVGIAAQTYITRDYLYSELMTHATKNNKIRVVVSLTSGTQVKTRWFKLKDSLKKP